MLAATKPTLEFRESPPTAPGGPWLTGHAAAIRKPGLWQPGAFWQVVHNLCNTLGAVLCPLS